VVPTVTTLGSLFFIYKGVETETTIITFE